MLVLFISVIFQLPAQESFSKTDYHNLEKYDNATLLKQSKRFIELDTLTEQAIAGFTIVANRYYENPKNNDNIKDAVEAMRELGNLYMTRDYDYKRAYDNLSRAYQLAEENAITEAVPYIDISLANLWQMNTHLNPQSSAQVTEYLHNALDVALQNDIEEALPVIAINIISKRMNKGSWGEYETDISRLKNHKFHSKPELLDFSRLMIEGTNAYFANDWKSAEEAITKAESNIDCKKFPERYRFSAQTALSRIYIASGRNEEAAKLLLDNALQAKNGGYPDYELHFYSMLANLYETTNRPDSLEKYYSKYLQLKQQLTAKENLVSVAESDFLAQIDKINEEVRQLSLKRMEQRHNILILTGILIVVLVIMVSVILSFINLRRNHRRLFDKNVELIKMNDELKALRLSAEQQKPSEESHDEPAESTDSKDPEPMLQQLYERILRVMSSSDEIYQLDFTVNRLGELVHSHYRYVSQAINQCAGSNFNQFLLDYRIREACRRMHSKEFENYTIEAIAESVGFRSRTSFSTLFKKKTGLTPAQYFKMAREEA